MYITAIKQLNQRLSLLFRQTKAADAYNLWSTFYDQQPDNLMLYLDELVFMQLLKRITPNKKVIVDVGCGTGRHWPKLLSQHPEKLIGYDVSEGMLQKLYQKFPFADARLAVNDKLEDIQDQSVDIIISTLTVAHLHHLSRTFAAWARVLKKSGDILITDFHPDILANGGKRDFTVNNKKVVVKNYVHTIEKIKTLANSYGMYITFEIEKVIDEAVKSFYEQQNALAVYHQFFNKPIIYGLHLQKQ